MNIRTTLTTMLALTMVILAGAESRVAAQATKSGPQKGEKVVDFQVQVLTGEDAGKTLSYVKRYEDKPVVAVFVRQADGGSPVNLLSGELIKTIDDKVGKHDDLKGLVVVMSDDRAIAQNLKQGAEARGIKNVPITTASERGAVAYQMPRDAAYVIVLWKDGKVCQNSRTFTAQEGLTKDNLKAIEDDLDKLVEEGKDEDDKADDKEGDKSKEDKS